MINSTTFWGKLDTDHALIVKSFFLKHALWLGFNFTEEEQSQGQQQNISWSYYKNY